MSKEEIFAWLSQTLQNMFELDAGRIVPEANLADLDIDSIDAVDVVVKFKELTGKRVQPEVFKSVRSVQDVVNALHALMQG